MLRRSRYLNRIGFSHRSRPASGESVVTSEEPGEAWWGTIAVHPRLGNLGWAHGGWSAGEGKDGGTAPRQESRIGLQLAIELETRVRLKSRLHSARCTPSNLPLLHWCVSCASGLELAGVSTSTKCSPPIQPRVDSVASFQRGARTSSVGSPSLVGAEDLGPVSSGSRPSWWSSTDDHPSSTKA